jgi:mannose-P-dolichol utilization defect 1
VTQLVEIEIDKQNSELALVPTSFFSARCAVVPHISFPQMDQLTSITRNLPPLIKDPATNLLGPPLIKIRVLLVGKHCYAVLVENLDIFDVACVKLGISKALGLGIVVAGSIVKLPQLLKLINAQSGEGLSLSGYILETLAYTITLAYNVRLQFPFSTYGETAFIAVQNILIALLILHYSGRDVFAAGALGGLLAFAVPLFSANVVSYRHLQILQGLSIPLSLASKVPQIVTNFRNGSTGQLSAFTVFNYLAGSAARVFTTMTEVNDPVILGGFLASVLLNAVLAVQMVLYWNKSPATTVGSPALKGPRTPTASSRPKTPKTPKTPKAPTTPTTPEGGKTTPKMPRSPVTPSRKGRGRKKN